MKVDRKLLITMLVAGAISGLMVVWLTPMAERLPPTNWRKENS